MTRELKLALIVGFAIVLTVAILVSDHLSKARQASLADVGAVNATRVSAKIPDEPIKSPDELLPATLQPAMRVTEPVLARGSEPVDATQAILPPSRDSQASVPEATTPPIVIGQGSAALQTTLLEPVSGDATYARREMVEAAPSNQVHQTPGETAATLSPAGDAMLKKIEESKSTSELKSEPKQTKPAALPIGPNDRTHTVGENESLYAISKRYYGNGNLWRQLAAANAGRVGENGSARVGARIVIPSRDVLMGKTETKTAARTETKSEPKASAKLDTKSQAKPATKPADAKTRSYTVKPGDSLGRIAARELGSSKRMAEIAVLNKMDPDDELLVGAILKLPAK